MEFNPGEAQTLFLRVESEGSVQIPLMLYEREEFYRQQ